MRSRYFRMLPLLLIALATLPAFAGDTPAPDSPNLTLGTVTVIGPTTCLSGAATGAACTTISVSCPGLPALDATLSQAFPTGAALGTIILMAGSGGTSFLSDGFANAYLDDGYRVVQFAWATDWELAGGSGLKKASCRNSTVFKYVFDNVQAGDRTTGFCAQGTSGGGAAITYAMSEYGLANYFDYVVIAAGPGVARVDYGCDKPLYKGPPVNVCSQLTNAPIIYTQGLRVLLNDWEGTKTCGTNSPPQADINKWAADSIVTTGANYSYPKTTMSWFLCVTPPVNPSAGQGKFLIDKVVPKNNPPDVNCYSGVCTGEEVWQDPTAFSLTESEMLSQCVPNHQ